MPPSAGPSTHFDTIRVIRDIAGDTCRLVRGKAPAENPEVELAARMNARWIIRELSISMFPRDVRTRFETEVRLLSEIESEHYNSLNCHQFDGNLVRLWYPYVEATTLLDEVQRQSLDPVDCLDLAIDLLDALVQIHACGCVHRDWRPSHILRTENQGAVLAGYGPIWGIDANARDSDVAIETARYSSPELAGIIKQDIGPPSDLYSLGLILYFALTGKPVFDAMATSEILLQQSTVDISADRLPAETPAKLIEVLERLTQKEPRGRYQSAKAVQHDCRAIREALRQSGSDANVVIGLSDTRQKLVDPAFVGRESQLATLKERVFDAIAGDASQCLLTCPSGMGKTRLIHELTRQATRNGVLVLQGDSIAQANQEPNAPWVQVVQQVASACGSSDQLTDRLKAALQDYREEVLTAMPALANAFDWQGRRLSGPDELGQGRVVTAFGKLISSLGASGHPVMIALDNCQWMDDQSIRVLRRVSRTFGTHQLLLLSTRTDEGQSEILRDAARLTHEVQVGPLAEDEIRQLAESMAGSLPAAAIDVVQEYAEGSPFMASAVLRGMVESNVLLASDPKTSAKTAPASREISSSTQDANAPGWHLDTEKLQDFQTAASAGEVLVGRLHGLSKDAQRFMDAAAVIGSEFQLDAVTELADIDLADAHRMLAKIRQQRLLWRKPNGAYGFVHDKIREAVLRQMLPETKRRMHGQIGRHFLKTQPDRVFDLAYHFDAAGLHRESLPHALVAARQACSKYSLGSAKQQLNIAARSFHITDRETRHKVEAMMSEVLMLQGEYDEAENWLVAAATSATTDSEKAFVDTRRGELLFKRGSKDKSVVLYESALSQLGQRVPRNSVDLIWRLAREIAVQIAHTAAPRLLLRRQEHGDPAHSTKDELIIRLYSDIAHGYWYTRDRKYALWAHLRGMNRAERKGSPADLAQSYSEHAPAMSLLGMFARGTAYAKRSLQIRTELGDIWGQGQSRNFLSILHYASGELEPCVAESGRAISILERTGDYWEVHIARYQYAAALYRQGNLREGLDQARICYRSAMQRSDFQATGNIIDIWSRAALGNIPLDVIQLELGREVNDAQRTGQVKLAYGVYLYYQGKFADAAGVLQEAVDLTRAASVANAYTSPCYSWLASALRKHLETQPPRTAAHRREQWKKIHRAAKRAVRIARRYPNDLPHALRELGASYASRGNPQQSRRCFERSKRIAMEQGAEFERIQTILLHEELASELNWSTDAEQVREAKELFQTIKTSVGATEEGTSLSLIDRFDALLEAGRRIAISTDLSIIRSEVLDAAAKLLRGDRVLIVQSDPQGNAGLTVPADVPFDAEIVRQSAAGGTAVLRENEIIGDRDRAESSSNESQTSYGTFLCCPIRVRGQIDSHLYIANSYMMGMFGEDEIRIANYLTSAAGAAIEKADGFNQLQELNQTLEGKVAERTATLQVKNEEISKTADRLRATQESLQLAKDAAEKANEAKSDFLARMSHEIRTPITAVLGFTELMLRGIVSDPAEQRENLETIHSNGSHLLHLLNDILDLSKIEADKIEVEQISCVPAKVVGDVIKSLHGKASQKGLNIRLESESDIPESISSDPTRLRQIVTNLIGNSLKFTQQGSVTVRLSKRLDANTGLPAEIGIAISDTGIGMDADQMERIFDPFAQADTSTTRKYGGTGLGLAISKRLAESLGGGLEVSSVPGQGSTFTIRIAANTGPGDRLLSEAEVVKLATGQSHAQWRKVDLKGTRVLVVDDAKTNRLLIRRLLTDSGAEVETLENGQLAVDRLLDRDGTLLDQDIDVVLMDMQMPVLDGYHATRLLCQAGITTPIIAMTANSMVGDDAKCRQTGCCDYLSKPIDLDALLELVCHWSGKETDQAQIALDPAAVAVSREPPPVVQAVREPAVDPPSVEQSDSHLPDDWLRQFAIDFVAKVNDQLPNVKRALRQNDLREVSNKVHWIKGSGGTVGLHELTELARGCEQAVEQNDTDQMFKTFDQIEAHIQTLVAECGDELPSLPNMSTLS